MARYVKTFPMVDSRENSFAKIQQLLTSKKFKYEPNGGEQIFRKGDGIWVVAKYIKIMYLGDSVRLEAWLNNTGIEMDLEGFYGSAVKKAHRKLVEQIEQILTQPAEGFVPQTAEQNVSYCDKCGTPLESGSGLCPQCTAYSLQVKNVSKKEYFQKYAGESFNKGVKSAAIIAYICVGVNAVVSLLLNPFGLLDSAILLALALGMHLKKSKGCAIAILVYAIFSMVMVLLQFGSIGGWLWLIAGVVAVTAFRNAEKSYKELVNQ